MVALAVLAGAVLACGVAAESPPVEITVRDSLLGAGHILRIHNLGTEPLAELEIMIVSANGEITHREAQLAAGDTLEVGWKKLGGYQIPEGAEVSIRAQGYLLAARAEVLPVTDTDEAVGTP